MAFVVPMLEMSSLDQAITPSWSGKIFSNPSIALSHRGYSDLLYAYKHAQLLPNQKRGHRDIHNHCCFSGIP